LRTVEGDVTGRVEPGVADYAVDDLLQFERVGFARFDALGERAREEAAERDVEADVVAYYAHP
jgi:glutamyl-tRNA synthetase